MMKFDAIRIHSAPQALAQQIVDSIGSGKLRPGSRLPSQRELAKAFEVGLGSVREAVKILDVLGYLQVLPGKGTFVPDQGPKQMEVNFPANQATAAASLSELMAARKVVECGAARLAAQQQDKASVKRLKTITSRMKRESDDIDAYYRNDFAFHLAVAKASHNSVILEIAKMLVEKSHHHIGFMNEGLGISMPENVDRCLNTAQNVVACIARGHGQQASRAMEAHLGIVNVEINKRLFRPTREKESERRKPNELFGLDVPS